MGTGPAYMPRGEQDALRRRALAESVCGRSTGNAIYLEWRVRLVTGNSIRALLTGGVSVDGS